MSPGSFALKRRNPETDFGLNVCINYSFIHRYATESRSAHAGDTVIIHVEGKTFWGSVYDYVSYKISAGSFPVYAPKYLPFNRFT